MASKGGQVGSDEAPFVNGFTVLRARMAQLPFVRVLYIKRHHSKKQEDGALPADRTIFVANAGMGEEALRGALADFGDIERVEMSGGKSQHGYVAAPEHDAAVSAGSDVKKLSHAHVVFRKKRSCEAALACNCAIQPAHIDETGEEGAESGVGVSGGGVEHGRENGETEG